MIAAGVALVTGASRGIGRATAIELARRGFDVVAGVRDTSTAKGLLHEATASSINLVRLDVTDLAAFRVPAGLRVLVNNAGIRREYLPVEETPLDEWRVNFETNTYGPAELCRLAVPVLRANGGGVICNVTSAALLSPLPFFGAYRASKAALSAMSESLRVELAPFDIRVIEILPGPIETDMLASGVMRRPPDAIRYPQYEPMARRSVTDPETAVTTSAETAAVAIADAILREGGPMRYGCDPVSVAMLERWRQASDEDLAEPMFERFLG